MVSKGTNTLAILSIICAFLFWPLGLIFGIVSLSQIKRTKEEGKGLAIAGVVLSSIALFITFIFFTSFFLAIGAVADSVVESSNEEVLIVDSSDSNVEENDIQVNLEEDNIEEDNVKEIGYKLKSGSITIDRVQIQLANLYPTRVTVENTGDVEINPEFDITVYDESGDSVCLGSPLYNEISVVSVGDSETTELNMLGCMFTEDGIYTLQIDLLDEDYQKLDSDSEEFEVDYWSQFDFS